MSSKSSSSSSASQSKTKSKSSSSSSSKSSKSKPKSKSKTSASSRNSTQSGANSSKLPANALSVLLTSERNRATHKSGTRPERQKIHGTYNKPTKKDKAIAAHERKRGALRARFMEEDTIDDCCMCNYGTKRCTFTKKDGKQCDYCAVKAGGEWCLYHIKYFAKYGNRVKKREEKRKKGKKVTNETKKNDKEVAEALMKLQKGNNSASDKASQSSKKSSGDSTSDKASQASKSTKSKSGSSKSSKPGGDESDDDDNDDYGQFIPFSDNEGDDTRSRASSRKTTTSSKKSSKSARESKTNESKTKTKPKPKPKRRKKKKRIGRDNDFNSAASHASAKTQEVTQTRSGRRVKRKDYKKMNKAGDSARNKKDYPSGGGTGRKTGDKTQGGRGK